MDDDMCQTRQEIIAEDPKLQKAQKELRRLESIEGNGAVRREILEYEMLLETRITGIQNGQNVEVIKDALTKWTSDHQKYPSLLYQLMKLPLMGWSIAGSTILFIWLVSQLGPELITQFVSVAGWDVEAAGINVVVGFVAILLLLNGIRRYIAYIKECDEASGHLAS